MTLSTVILDDGAYFVELNCNYLPRQAPGFLWLRCGESGSKRPSCECIGGFDQAPDGTWRAGITGSYDAERDTDETQLVKGVHRLDAIVTLWQHRRQAFIERGGS